MRNFLYCGARAIAVILSPVNGFHVRAPIRTTTATIMREMAKRARRFTSTPTSLCSSSSTRSANNRKSNKSVNMNMNINIDKHNLELFRSGQLPIMAIPSILPNDFIDRLKYDSQFLQGTSWEGMGGNGNSSAGVGVGAGVGAGAGTSQALVASSQSIRKNVHQTWLSSIGEPLRQTMMEVPMMKSMSMSTNKTDDSDYADIGGVRMEFCSWVEYLRWILVHGQEDEIISESESASGGEMKNLSEEERRQRYYESLWGGGDDVSDNKGIKDTTEKETEPLLLLEGIDSLHPNFVELSYLSYQPGSFYRRHVDRFRSRSRSHSSSSDTKPSSRAHLPQPQQRLSERVVSFILYLGSDDETHSNECDHDHEYGRERVWDIEKDGGALRIYGTHNVQFLTEYSPNHPIGYVNELVNEQNMHRQVYFSDSDFDEDLKPGETCVDIPPLPGTLVLLDSCKVPHAVRETKRSRRCIVGWFGSPVSAYR